MLKKFIISFWLILFFVVSNGYTDENITLLTRAHSHNDYIRRRPLFEALENGFCSVEADIYWVNGDLLVAHDLDKCKPERNLRDMYLKPIFECVRRNNGHVYQTSSEFWFLIDIKNEPEKAYALLREQLEPYKSSLTRIENGKKINGAVTVVISGAVPREAITKDTNRYAFIDGRIDDLDKNLSPELVPWISNSWFSIFSWNGKGEIPEQERQKLREIVKRAHEEGKKVRFWDIPQTQDCWEVLYEEGVDFLHSDVPYRLSNFFKSKIK
ncbi:MAG TPA: phosphatidylinositol-specific phospholipase C/glycerophosphodiester phosphodiesterase family protein [Candidatus Hydrogenedens sp.]|nr:phosphatidylinositol-specific phospholipase C/glycerophosphodiester phosphodiesterase family protein [Candidatus Hydrogenedens sp.]